jgi:hypothetical protein
MKTRSFVRLLCGIVVFTISAEAGMISENDSALVGHWRKTTITFDSPTDHHLVLAPNGTGYYWTVTASGRSAVEAGRWSVEGNVLLLVSATRREIGPFTFHQGDLIFPNISGRRGIWERLR